jgi:NAD(P)H-flavin reductase
MSEQTLNAVVTLRNEVSPWLMILQVVPDGALTPRLFNIKIGDRIWLSQKPAGKFTYLPVVSRPTEEPVPWKSATGHVQDVWKYGLVEKAWGSRPGPDNTHVFICGSPHMSESMLALFIMDGFKEHTKKEPGQIHLEKYW